IVMDEVNAPTSGEHLGGIPGALPFRLDTRARGVLRGNERANVALLDRLVVALAIAGPANKTSAAVHGLDAARIPASIAPSRLHAFSDQRMRPAPSGSHHKARLTQQ